MKSGEYMNKKKMFLLCLMLFLLVGFGGVMIVNGEGESCPSGACGNGGSSGSGSIPPCGASWCWDIRGTGVRISLIRQGEGDGKQEGHYIDVFGITNNPSHDPVDNRVVWIPSSGGNIKQDVGKNISFESTNQTLKQLADSNPNMFYLTAADSNIWYFSSNVGITNFTNASGKTKGEKAYNYYSTFLKYLQNSAKNGLDEMYEELDMLFEQLGYSTKISELDEEEINRLYIQFEPIIIARERNNSADTYKVYYGTVTEIANMSYSTDQNNLSGYADYLGRAWSIWYYGAGLEMNGAGPKPFVVPTESGDSIVARLVKTQGAGNRKGYADKISENNNVGYGVSHIWLGSLLDNTKSCTFILEELIKKNPSIYGNRGSAIYQNAIKAIQNFDITYEFKDSDGSIYHIDKAYAIYEYDGADWCTPQTTECGTPPLIDLDLDCTSGINSYKDSNNKDYWLTCGTAYIFNGTYYTSENTGHEAVETDNGGVVGNSEYCKLYCYEEFITDFPDKVTEVKAGQTFGWGHSGYRESNVYGTIKVHKVCSNRERTDAEGLTGEGYLYKKWENDYKENEKNLIQSYLKKGAAEIALDKVTASATNNVRQNCCLQPLYKDGVQIGCISWGWQTSVSVSGINNNLPTGEDVGGDGWTTGAVGQSVSVNSSLTASGCYASKEVAINKAVTKANDYLENIENTSQSAYEKAKNEESELLKKINQCTQNLKYVYKTVVTLSFDEPENSAYGANDRAFSYHDPLLGPEPNQTFGPDGYEENNVDTSSCTKKYRPRYKCDGNGSLARCYVEKIEAVWDCKQVTWELEGEWTYKYPEEQFTWFSLKKDNKLMNLENKTSDGDEFFYSLGYGLPTAFTLPSGIYDMSVIVSNVGDNAVISDVQDNDATYNITDGHFGPTLAEYDDKKGFEYACTYEVDNDIFGYDCEYQNDKITSNSPAYCDDKKDSDPDGELIGIDVAYRLVSLLNPGDDISKAFPGQDGEGRRIGLNWLINEEIIPDILDASVYEQNLAMYEIFMDVKKIQEIRQDSRSFSGSGDAYTSFDNIKCAQDSSDGNKKYCASDFLSELASTGSKETRLYGTCITSFDTQERANDVLDNGCHGTYTFPTINWVR